MNVVIVESPAKAKTINKYLGKDYKVLASYGHIRDLPSKDGSVKPDEDFAMSWEIDARSEKQVREIVSALKDATKLVLATDPDREGEAIAWHVYQELNSRGKIKNIPVERVVFHEITKKAVTQAIANPRTIDAQLVSAYLARRALDYLVGFNLSPVLWKKLPGCRSAGRVQSVALRLICEREIEIEDFNSQEYWSVDVDLETVKKAELKSKLIVLDGEKLEKFSLKNEQDALVAKQKIEAQQFKIAKVTPKKVTRQPAPAFTTSTLQQEAARKLYFSASKTMQVAQKLYEGVEIKGESVGLITYMRTDSVSIAQDAINDARAVIRDLFGDSYMPSSPRFYKNKTKNAQEAHEAIRPTNLKLMPSDVAKYLDADQKKLYDLIWTRTIASQMENAILNQVSIDSESNDKQITLRATGQVIDFDGFLKLYKEDSDDGDDEDKIRILPKVSEGENVKRGDTRMEQHFTQPPPRYSEASLVKKLEELGIGRPSTYASIISVLQSRNYVTIDKRRFFPEDRGRIVTAFLESYFNKYVQYNFTADMEDKLDDISSGSLEWKDVLKVFWKDFTGDIQEIAPVKMSEVLDKLDEVLGKHFFPATEDGTNPRACPQCDGGQLSIKIGKFGAFIGCSNYPTCNYTRPLTESTDNGENGENGESIKADEADRLLGSGDDGLNIYVKKGPYGFYIQSGESAKGAEKPKRVPLLAGMKPEEVTIDEAKGLLSLPRTLGKHPKSGESIQAGIGRFGPFLKYGSAYKSMPKTESVLTVSLAKAIEIIDTEQKNEPIEIGKHPDDNLPITLQKGRFGPYVKHGKINASLPKRLRDKEVVTLEEALELLAEKAGASPAKPVKGKKAGAKKAPAQKKTPAKKKA